MGGVPWIESYSGRVDPPHEPDVVAHGRGDRVDHVSGDSGVPPDRGRHGDRGNDSAIGGEDRRRHAAASFSQT